MTAMNISRMPHATVSHRDNFNRCSFVAPGLISGLYKSRTVVDARELSEPLKFDMAAAKIAAITSAEMPCGKRVTINVGKISSLLASATVNGWTL